MVVCPACKGQKKIWGAGMISQHDCKHCSGVGKVKAPVKEEVVNDSSKASSVGIDVDVVISDSKSGLAEILKEKPKAKPKVAKKK